MDMRVKQKLVLWLEEYLFFPTPLGQIISALLLPLTLIYCLVKFISKISAKPKYLGIKVVSVGNLILGGTGKTPFIISLVKEYKKSAIVLRGYKRNSSGLKVVSQNGTILETVDVSGDEAMLLALKCPNSIVIVSEDRKDGILKAKELGADIVFLDDGYSKRDILKLDIVLRPKKEPTNVFCLPSGGYKEPKIEYLNAHIVACEDIDYKRNISFSFYNHLTKEFKNIEKLPNDIVFVSGISKPKRVLEFLPNNIAYEFFEDHHKFSMVEILNIEKKYDTKNMLVTHKDLVKLLDFDYSFYVINLDIVICDDILSKVKEYYQINFQSL